MSRFLKAIKSAFVSPTWRTAIVALLVLAVLYYGLFFLAFSGLSRRHGGSDIYDLRGEPNADHIAQNYIVTGYDHYAFTSFGASLGATTALGSTGRRVKIFPVGATGDFICYFIPNSTMLPGSRPGYRPFLCVKKDLEIVHEFGTPYLTPLYWPREDYAPNLDLELVSFEPCPNFIPLIDQAYREMQPVTPGESPLPELRQISGLRLSMYLPLRECPEVGIKGELLFGDNGIMYWSSFGLQLQDIPYLVVGPYDKLPVLPEGGERFVVE